MLLFDMCSNILQPLLPFLSKAIIIASFGTSCLGIPSQIYENYTKQSTDGFSVGLALVFLLGYSVWFLYGVAIKDLNITISQFPGVVFSFILAMQFVMYWKHILLSRKQAVKPLVFDLVHFISHQFNLSLPFKKPQDKYHKGLL